MIFFLLTCASVSKHDIKWLSPLKITAYFYLLPCSSEFATQLSAIGHLSRDWCGCRSEVGAYTQETPAFLTYTTHLLRARCVCTPSTSGYLQSHYSVHMPGPIYCLLLKSAVDIYSFPDGFFHDACHYSIMDCVWNLSIFSFANRKLWWRRKNTKYSH